MQFPYPALPSPDWIATEGAEIERLVVHVWAEWNGHDIQMGKNLIQAQHTLLPLGIELRSLELDDKRFWPFLKQYGAAHAILNVPAILLFSKGELREKHVGLLDPETLAGYIAGALC